jgi:DinB family protein
MQYMKLNDVERESLLSSLAGMTDFLSSAFAGLTDEQARTPGPEGAFAPVEQVWHLADLEREGFGLRIRRLQAEDHPHLPDFDGTTIARERDYRSLSLQEGLRAFSAARAGNLAALRAVSAEDWTRAGTQAGVGDVSLCDMPAFLLQHDDAHKAEIEDWRRYVSRGG